MPCSVAAMRNALLGKLCCQESEGRRHTKYKLYRNGQMIAATGISRNVAELGGDLIRAIAHELCIQTNVLKQIYECPYGLTEYLAGYNPDLNPHRRVR